MRRMGRAEGHEPGRSKALLWRWEAMRKGKSRTRNARTDIMRANAANARRRARKYDQRQYDKPQIEES